MFSILNYLINYENVVEMLKIIGLFPNSINHSLTKIGNIFGGELI